MQKGLPVFVAWFEPDSQLEVDCDVEMSKL